LVEPARQAVEDCYIVFEPTFDIASKTPAKASATLRQTVHLRLLIDTSLALQSLGMSAFP
jgi:hypothetical protein